MRPSARAPTVRVGGRPALPDDALAHAPLARALVKPVADIADTAGAWPGDASGARARASAGGLVSRWPRGAADEEAVWEGVFKDIRSL